MDDFGVGFSFGDASRFEELRVLIEELKKDKDAQEFRNPEEWLGMIPDAAKSQFYWPSTAERQGWLASRPFTPIAVGVPEEQIGSQWDFYRVFESIEEGDYALLACQKTSENTGEIRIDPYGFPYGGLGALIAIVEAFGFRVLGVNEYGEYQSLQELFGDGGAA